MLIRFIQISFVLLKYLVFYPFNRYRKFILGKRLRLAFAELGLTFIKIGQILSMRYDLLRPEDCRELQELLDNVNPLDYKVIENIIKKEYGRLTDKIFAKFCKRPISSASISQVHKAVLPDGTIVAVKIKRPDVDIRLKSDIAIIKVLAYIAKIFSPTLRRIRIIKVINYFETWIKQDIDFVQEVKNINLVYNQYAFSRNKKIRNDLGVGIFPKPYESICTRNVIVMDYIDGVSLKDIDTVKDNSEYDIQKSIKTYLNASIRNLFIAEEYVFQADPHLSNILILPNGNSSNIDCGLIGHFTKEETKVTKQLIMAVYLKDEEEVVRLILSMTGSDYQRYADRIRPDIKAYLRTTDLEGVGYWFMEITRIIIVKHRLIFPSFLHTFGRCNLILDSLVKMFFPGETTVDLFKEEFRKEAIKQITNNIKDMDLVPVFFNISKKIKQSPDIINDFVNNPVSIFTEIRDFIKS